MWEKLLEQKQNKSEKIDWSKYEIVWPSSTEMDFSWWQEQFKCEWESDERDSSTSKRKEDPERDSETTREDRARTAKGLGQAEG